MIFIPGGGYWEAVPIVLRVQLRPFTRLTVRLRPGQLVSDIVAVEEQLRERMSAEKIRIEHVAADVVSIELWGGQHGPRFSDHDVA
jgi:hypothetical protein